MSESYLKSRRPCGIYVDSLNFMVFQVRNSVRDVQFLSFLISAVLLFTSSFVLAEDVLRPQSLDEFGPSGTLTAEKVYRVKGTESAYMNFAALRRDFPAIASWSDGDITELMLHNLSFIGSEQAKLNTIRSTPIPIDTSVSSVAYRPRTWIRSSILPIFLPDGTLLGFVDVKGFGHGARSVNHITNIGDTVDEWNSADENKKKDIQNKGHSDGLMSLGEAFAEGTRQSAIQKIFDITGVGLETVETYGIMRMPFNILRGGAEIPAAFYIRSLNEGEMEYNARPYRFNNTPVPADIYMDKSGVYQSTRSLSVIDFGGALVTHPLVKNLFVGGEDPATVDPQKSNAWAWAHQAAEAFVRSNSPDKNVFYTHLADMMRPLERLDASPNVIAAQRRREELRAKAKTLRASGVSYSKIVEKLAPWETAWNVIFSDRPFMFSRNALIQTYLSRNPGWLDTDVRKAQVKAAEVNNDTLLLLKKIEVEPKVKSPETSIKQIVELISSPSADFRDIALDGLVQNPALPDIFEQLLPHLTKSLIAQLSYRYSKALKPSLKMHRYFMDPETPNEDGYRYNLFNKENRIPWEWKKTVLENGSINVDNFATEIAGCATTPMSYIKGLISRYTGDKQRDIIVAAIQNPSTPKSFIEKYATNDSSRIARLAQYHLALRRGDDLSFLEEVKGFKIKDPKSTIECKAFYQKVPGAPSQALFVHD